MEDAKDKKQMMRDEIAQVLGAFSQEIQQKKNKAIEERLFDFANFMEAKIALLYLLPDIGVTTFGIIKRCLENSKMVVLPQIVREKNKVKMLKIDNLEQDLVRTDGDQMVPDPQRCKVVPIQCVDIAIIPGVAFDEKGGRLGRGHGNYDRLIPKLPNTTRKVAVAFEDQIVPQVPMESHDKHVDIIISEERVIYKI